MSDKGVLRSFTKGSDFQQLEPVPTISLHIKRLDTATRGTVPPRSMFNIRMEGFTSTKIFVAGRRASVQVNPRNALSYCSSRILSSHISYNSFNTILSSSQSET